IEKLEKLPKALILSPGPCSPSETPQTMELIRKSYKTIPILGICLGHQCINEAFNGTTYKAPIPMHGKASNILH
ncbi:MAG: glutamine amidotransferase-related protein, partial [Bdellovibrionales bacterium]